VAGVLLIEWCGSGNGNNSRFDDLWTVQQVKE
jgi:hypothetical protein